MKFKKIFLSSLALLGALTVVSCGKDDVTVTNFQTISQTYVKDEDMSFVLMLNIPNTYRVDTAVISSSYNETYTMKAETTNYVSYTLSQTTSGSTVKYDGISYTYYLKKVTYYDANNEKHEIDTNESTSISSNSNKDLSGIEVNTISISGLKTNENNELVVDASSKISLVVDLKNTYDYKITALNFVFTDDEGTTSEIRKILVGENTKGSNIKIDLDTPDFIGTVSLKIASVEYDTNSKSDKVNVTSEKIAFHFDAVVSTLTKLSISENGTYKTNTVYDTEDAKCVQEGQTVYLNATFSIPENTKIKSLKSVYIQSGSNEVEATIAKSSIGLSTINAVIAFTTKDSNLKVTDYKLTKYVLKTDLNNVTYNVSSAKQDSTKISLKTYKKVISSEDDFITLQNAGTTLTGTTLVSVSNGINYRSVNVTNSLNLDGHLIFNTTIKNYSGSVPLFNTISNKSIMEGLVIDTNCTFNSTGLGSAFVCKENNGVIKNMKLDYLKIYVTNKHTNSLGMLLINSDAVIGTNNGQVKNSSMQHLTLSVTHPTDITEDNNGGKNPLTYSTLINKNTGTVSNVVVSYSTIASMVKDRNVNLFVRNNEGVIQNSWFGMTFDEQYMSSNYDIDIAPTTGEGTFANIYTNTPGLEVSKEFLTNQKINMLDIDDVNNKNSGTATVFWESLGFKIIKGNFGWQLTAQGISLSI